MKAMIIKIVFGSLLGVGAAVMLLLAFLLYYKYMVQEKRCNRRTLGIVKSYTLASKGEHSGIHLPIVHYTVDGKEYKVTGPEYKAYIIKTKSTPVSGNEVNALIKKQVLYVSRLKNSFIGIKSNPMQSLFPIGSQIDVFYDESNPKLAYVMRYCNKKWSFLLLFLAAIAMLVLDAVILILPFA